MRTVLSSDAFNFIHVMQFVMYTLEDCASISQHKGNAILVRRYDSKIDFIFSLILAPSIDINLVLLCLNHCVLSFIFHPCASKKVYTTQIAWTFNQMLLPPKYMILFIICCLNLFIWSKVNNHKIILLLPSKNIFVHLCNFSFNVCSLRFVAVYSFYTL